MPQKLHRRRTKVFHKKNRAPLKAAAWILAAALIVTGGYFGAKFVLERPEAVDGPGGSQESSAVSSPPPASSDPAPSQPAQDPSGSGSLQAVYLPLATLTDDTQRSQTLSAASAAGFTAVLFDLKGSDGRLAYASATPLALQAQSGGDLSLEELEALFGAIKEAGFTPIPRLYAFRDPLAPSRLPAAKIALGENSSWTWYDGDPQNGGRPWLNPYADAAHEYLIGLMDELQALGADTILLDGVEFPRSLGDKTNFTAEQLTSQSKAGALAAFVAKARQAMGDGTVLLASPGLAVLGTDTVSYGGNPVTFGAEILAPMLLPSTLGNSLTFGETTVEAPAAHPYDAVKAALSQLQARLQVIEADSRPQLMPWLQANDYSAADVGGQIRAVTEALGPDASYILYSPDGVYDFAALT